MKIHLWQSYASNNSSYFRVISSFKSADEAIDAADAVRKYYEKNGYRSAWAEDEDEAFDEDVGVPEVVVAGSMVAVYHTYTDSETFDDNLPSDVLEEHGGEVGEVDERYGVTLQAFVTVPEGAAGAKMRKELDAFFAQAESGEKNPPWAGKAPKNWSYETDELLWFCAGDTYGVQMQLRWSDEAEWMRDYFSKNKADHWMYLCDEAALDKIRLLSQGLACPECNNTVLSYLVADGEKIPEDQLVCSGCGGMFTLGAMMAHAPVTQIGEERLNGVSMFGDVTLVLGRGGSVYRSQAGSEFKRVKEHDGQLWSIFVLPGGSPETQTVLVFGTGTILRSTNGGVRWTNVKNPASGYLFNASRTPAGALFVVGDGMLRSDDGGETWQSVKVPAKGNNLLNVGVVDDDLLFVVGHGGVILRSDNGGKTWRHLESPVSTPLCRIRCFNEREAVTVGDGGVVLTTADGGVKWTRRKVAGLKGDIEDLTVGNDGRLYAVASGGKILISDDRGKSWTMEASGTTEHLWAIASTASGTLLMVGESGTLVRKGGLDVPLDDARDEPPREPTAGPALATVGRNFLFTGKLSGMTRAEAKARVNELGGVAKSSVTKDLHYLVVGDEGSPLFGEGKKGSKILAAEKLVAEGAALQIISEGAFMKLQRAE